MNWLEREVPSLELCKKLKEIGYPQDTDGYLWTNAKKVWLCGEDSWQITEDFYLVNEKPYYPLGGIPQTDWAKKQRDDWYSKLQMYKAPTCREMAEWLPPHKDLQYSKFTGFWKFDKDGYQLCFGDKICFQAENEVTVRAKMLIWLKQHDYIDFKEEA